jgi:outer membrane protein assembly factor BamB
MVTIGGAMVSALADEWPQWRGPSRDGVWHETGILEKFDKPQLDLVWRAEIGSGYSGPTVWQGFVYVTDRLVSPKQVEQVHCFDAQTGKKVWTHEYDCAYRDVGYDAGPRASVTIDDARAYSLGAMGNLFCFNARNGKIIWQKDLNAEYKIRMPTWGIASAPLVEGNLLIVQIGGDNACFVAFDKATGSEAWRALNDGASYSAPIVIDQAGKRVLAAYTGDNVVGLSPTTGDVYWKYPFPPKQMVIGIASPVVNKDRLFVTNFFDGSLMLKLGSDQPSVEKLWKRAGEDEQHTDALHAIISTPILEGEYIYGVDSYGELRCLDANTGDRIWESLDAVPKARWATIHFVGNGDKVWMFNERGELIISRLSPNGFTEISRAKLIAPTTDQLRQRGGVAWAHPAFAYKHVFARNDKELVCANLSRGQ